MASAFPLRQQVLLALTPKFASSLSIPCSLFIIREIFLDYRAGRSNAIQRALVGMSTVDILSSMGWFFSTWAAPKETDVVFAAGNAVTCDVQGFLLQLAVGAPLYNSSLALFYVLVIKYGWRNEMLVSIERYVHFIILCFALGTSFMMIPMKLYNNIGAVCWVVEKDCQDSQPGFLSGAFSHASNCERGENAWAYGLFLFYVPLWICVLLCFSCMTIIYFHVKSTHRRASVYNLDMRRSASDTSLVATQAFLYSLSFVVTWMPSTIWSIAIWFGWDSFWFHFMAALCEPLQGFWNFLIFLRSHPRTQYKIQKFLHKIDPRLARDPQQGQPENVSQMIRKMAHRDNEPPPQTSSSAKSSDDFEASVEDFEASVELGLPESVHDESEQDTI